MTTLSVVIPALNEEDGIQDIMARVLSTRSNLKEVNVQDLELIVVDDGSTDRTAELVTATDGVRLIRHVTNGGYGAALKTGFAAARGEWVGFLDADGTYPPEYYPALCQAAQEQNADITSASLSLVGLQLMLAWVQMQVLDALKARENLIANDMRTNGKTDVRVKAEVRAEAKA